MVSVCTVPARGGRSCEHFGGYKTINRIPLSKDKQTLQMWGGGEGIYIYQEQGPYQLGGNEQSSQI